MAFRLCILSILFVGLANTSHISLRSNLIPTEYEPYQVFVASGGSSYDFGAGVPITRRHVLTAASLVRGYLEWSVAFGSSELSGLEYIETNYAVVHPNYNPTNYNNNLGVIILPHAFPEGVVYPIAMPSANDATFPRVNQEGRLVGFGLIDNKNIDKPAPNQHLKTVFLTVSQNCENYFPGTDATRNFCAADPTPDSVNLCQGDLGSAFVVTLRGRHILAGLTASVSKTCKPNEHVTFTRIHSYMPWISSVTGQAEQF